MARYLGLSLALVLLAGSASAQEAPEPAPAPEAAVPAPRYLPAVRAELERLSLAPVCEVLDPARARCNVRHRTGDAAATVDVRVLIDETSDTVYVYASLGLAGPEELSTPAVLRRLAALNWRHLATKLEWDPSDGSMRMSAVQHTDSNFDRLAFRRLMRLLPSQAETIARELRALQESAPVGD